MKGKEALVVEKRIKLAPETIPSPRKAYSPAWCSNRFESIYERDEGWVDKPLVDSFPDPAGLQPHLPACPV